MLLPELVQTAHLGRDEFLRLSLKLLDDGHARWVAAARGTHKRRLARGRQGKHVRSTLEEHLAKVGLTIAGRVVQRRIPKAVHAVHARAAVEQDQADADVALHGSEVQWRVAKGLVENVWIGPIHEQKIAQPAVATERRIVQRRRARF